MGPTANDAPTPPEKEPQEEVAYVIDPTVQPDGPKRTHEQLHADGRKELYTFAYQKPLEVILPHALRFLENGFLVYADPECTRQLRRTRSAKDGHDGQVVQALADHEVIANLDELTKPALYKRVAALPGGDAIKPLAAKEEMVAFVLKFNRDNAQRREAVEIDDLIEGGGVSAGEVQSLEVAGAA